MKILILFLTTFFIQVSYGKQMININPTGYAPLTAATWVTSATVSESFSVPVAKMLSLVFNKTGLSTGTIKLQGSPDNISWKDINTTTYPDATAAVTSGSSSTVLSLIANPFPYIRYLFTEGGQGNGTGSGRITTK